MIGKKYSITALVIAVLLTGGFFGWRYFSDVNAKKIEIRGEIAENDNPAEIIEEENPEVSPEEAKNNNPAEVKPLKTDNQDEKETTADKAAETGKISITNKFVSWGYEKASSRKIDTLVIHSTYNALGGDPFSLEKILDIYKSYGVSPHYIVDRSGKIYRLAADENIAYHAGESSVPDGRKGVNNFSIGIELINSKTEKPAASQYSALSGLINNLKSKYKIKYVLGHDQIAPGRKDDPWNMDWSKVKK